ncbi:MAG: carboxypeptidase-like regulatory domain-containing protein [Rhodothermales bacterium]
MGVDRRGVLIFCCFIAAYLLLFDKPALAQHIQLRGTVADAVTGQSLPGVNVFIDQTVKGSATDENGAFQIKGFSAGSYKVVASMIGYEVASEQIELTPADSIYTLHIDLTPSITEMGEISVVDKSSRAWRKDFRRFRKLFLGESGNVRHTEILNPHALDFTQEGGVFSAQAYEPLEIINRALGYKVTFILTDFRLEQNKGLLHTQGPFYFSPLAPASKKEERKWASSREKTYKGSLTHLLASLARQSEVAQGFSIRYDDRSNAPYSQKRPALQYIAGVNIMQPTSAAYLFRISFPEYLFVTYAGKQSWLKMNTTHAIVHESGYVFGARNASGAITVYGALSKRRIADLLPRDYRFKKLSVFKY